jgi:hypothetical protein
VDETGCSDHSDSRQVHVIVPIDCQELWIPVPWDRHSKRSTFVACIAATGFRMKPFAIVDRATAERELKYYGYDASNVGLTCQANTFPTSSLVELWARTIFFPNAERRREDLAYHGEVLLLLYGLRSHHTPKFLFKPMNRTKIYQIYGTELIRQSS